MGTGEWRTCLSLYIYIHIGYIYMCVHNIYLYMYICMSISLSICLTIHLCLYLGTYLPSILFICFFCLYIEFLDRCRITTQSSASKKPRWSYLSGSAEVHVSRCHGWKWIRYGGSAGCLDILFQQKGMVSSKFQSLIPSQQFITANQQDHGPEYDWVLRALYRCVHKFKRTNVNQ